MARYFGITQNADPAVANAYLRSETTTGLSTGTENYTEAAARGLLQGVINGTIFIETPDGANLVRDLAARYGVAVPANLLAPRNPGAAPAAPAAPGAGTFQEGERVTLQGQDLGTVRNGLPGGLGLEWHELALKIGSQAAEEALARAQLTGELDGVPTLERQRLEQEIAQRAIDNALREAAVTGTFNGQETFEARQFREQLGLEQQRLGLEQQRFGFDQQQAVAQAVADPNRFVEGAALANTLGSARAPAPAAFLSGLQGQPQTPGQPAAFGAPASTGASGQPDLGQPGQSPTDATKAAVAAANPQLALSPEMVMLLSGQSGNIPAFGNPEGVAGQTTMLRQAVPTSGDFSRVNPVAYFQNVSDTGQRQYQAVAQANTGVRPEDLRKGIANQLPGRSLPAPAAFSF